ncbi:MAG: hypothetical protein GF418_15560 [Chitinivibrionales bacterium]|nr:hypothetical protein [Chitinivibrionales bacterium]MBD3397038.1 hypothetical protein [Chitinivibrionales bacterium]
MHSSGSRLPRAGCTSLRAPPATRLNNLIAKGTCMRWIKRGVLAWVCVLSMCAKSPVPKDAVIGVNGEWIMADEVAYVAELLRKEAARFSPETAVEGMSDGVRKSTAKQLIADRLMLQEARKMNITVEEARFDTLYEEFKKGVGGKAGLTRMLTMTGQSEEEFRARVRDGMLVDSLVKLLLAGMDSVTIADCKAFYDENRKRFSEREKVRTSQILVKLSDDMSAEKKAAAREKAEKALAGARAGEDFAALAKEYSEGPNAATGGDIGWFEKGDMKPAIDAAIFALEKDAVSDIVTTDIGFHIFKRTGAKMSEPKRFHEVQDMIKTSLELKKKNDIITSTIDSLTAAADIVYVDTSLAP